MTPNIDLQNAPSFEEMKTAGEAYEVAKAADPKSQATYDAYQAFTAKLSACCTELGINFPM